MPVHSSVTDREYREARARLRMIVSTSIQVDAPESHPERPTLVSRLAREVATTIETRELRKRDHDRLHGYADGLLAMLEAEHTERRCWHRTTGTWRPEAEGKAYVSGRLPAEAGVYAPEQTVTFWKPDPDAKPYVTGLCVYSGAVADGYGTRFSSFYPFHDTGPAASDQETVRPSQEFVAVPASMLKDSRPSGVGMVLSLPGRHGAGQTDAILSKSGLLHIGRLDHHPFLVFEHDGNLPGLHVKIVKTVSDVLAHGDDTPVMLQWPGQTRSDWFWFTVGDLRDHLNRLAEARG